MFIYNLFIHLYKSAICILSFFNPTIRLMRNGESSAINTIATKRKKGERWVWIHAASLGEFEQGRPLIERIRHQKPEYKILLTFFSPSGFEIRKNYAGADLITYLPLDTPRNARRFIEVLRPEKVYIVKYEFWLNYLSVLRKNNIETYIISAIFRPSQPFFKWYGSIFRQCLKTFRTLYVQNDESVALLNTIGISNAVAVGDTRFDRVTDIASTAKQLPIVSQFTQNHTTIIAGSSWDPDEQLLAPYINSHAADGIRMIIAPHHVEPERIAQLTSRLTCRFALYTDLNDNSKTDFDVLIINTIGILSSIYQYGKVAYIGGGFGVGIHNTLEAAVWGLPVVFGPNYHKFREACELIECGGAKSISNEQECTEAFDYFISNNPQHAESARQYVATHIGATDIIYRETI
ncbi:MAG: 3-deoxy-D-manno-octulosonic acid transferase [Paludibacteraceae bacterium]|nr:3-deoxy-D-manno-octulosonic acid transferase [Paludibacteraceae bacterium]